jgi:prepilin-type N-terminal cleavage/methylation domain-containing protein
MLTGGFNYQLLTCMHFSKQGSMACAHYCRRNSKQGSLGIILASPQGFTLVELLVSIIIVGLLAAIALPSFLSQEAKARGSEAKAHLGMINRSQFLLSTLD